MRVSITLSPTAATSVDELTAAVRLIRLRAIRLGLQRTNAAVSGQNIVLSGLQSDEAQLKAITTAGVLRMRQVLLEEASGDAVSYGDAGAVLPDVLKLFNKLTCSPDGAWQAQVGYTTSADWDNPGVQTVSCDRDGTKYALDAAKVLGEDMTGASAMVSAASGEWRVAVTLNGPGTTAFSRLTTALYSRYAAGAQSGNQDDLVNDQVAIVVDGTVLSAPEILGPLSGGVAQITGNYTRSSARELAAQLQGGFLPADFRISSITTYTSSSPG